MMIRTPRMLPADQSTTDHQAEAAGPLVITEMIQARIEQRAAAALVPEVDPADDIVIARD
jgi:hypothetical protein